MAKPKFKPLLYTTTMRNPERLKFILYILAKFRGQILNDELATKIVGETIRYGLYRPMKQCDTIKSKWASTPNGTFSDYILTDEEVKYMLTMNPQQHKEAGFAKGFPSRFATIYDFTKEMGLAYFAPQRSIIISELGEHLLKSFNLNVKDNEILYELINPEYEQQVFLQAMARSQRKNPFVRVLNDNIPLILLLQTIKLLNADPKQNGAGISRRELPLLIFWKDNNAKSLYDRIVQLRGDCGYNPSDEVIIDICINEIMEGNYKKFDPESIMVDYPDEFIRKMRITGLFSLRGAGRFVDINKNEIDKVEYVIDKYANYSLFTDEIAYFNHIATLDKNLIEITAKTVTPNNAERLLTNWLNQYAWDVIKKELAILSSGGTSKDSVLKLIAAPTRLEFLTALAIKSKIPNVRVLPNYSCDDEGLPTSTAGGNKGDIECFEQQKGILVEVTMATGRQQTVMEIWPIERHLTDFQKDKKAQCVFIAPSIFDDSKRQIKFVRMDSKGEKEIRPYAISEFVNFLENSKCLYVNHSYGIDYSTSSLAAEPPAPYGN
ncbi:MAG: AlwI family type II restriction endonuclease [Paludibacteraceae bacterium]|nr:AlwI family type II restriction endonuclease [Paludibacteraceae bacterium]